MRVLISHFHHQETYEQKQSPHIYRTKLYTEIDRDSENLQNIKYCFYKKPKPDNCRGTPTRGEPVEPRSNRSLSQDPRTPSSQCQEGHLTHDPVLGTKLRNTKRGTRNPGTTKRRLDTRRNTNRNRRRDRRKIRSATPKTKWRALAQHATNQLRRARHQRAFQGEAKHVKHTKNHNRNANTYIRKLTGDTNIPNKPIEGISPMKIPYKREIRICSLSVRGLKESAKREQIIQQMIRHRIDVACLQEAHIHDFSIETRDKHSSVLSSNALNKKEDWGVGFCFRNGFEKYRTNYIQINSNVATLELSMHGNPLVIISAYLPHDAVLPLQQPRRTAAWEELETTINNISEAKNISLWRLQCCLASHQRGRRRHHWTTHFRKGIRIP